MFLPAAVSPPVTLEIKDYVAFPITGRLDGTGQTDGMLARINSLRDEPGGRNRFFISDLNGPLYILDKATKKFSIYLDFNGSDGRTGIFRKLTFEAGSGTALNVLSRSRLHAQREVLHRAHRGSSAAGLQPSQQRRRSRPERLRAIRDDRGRSRRLDRCRTRAC